MDTLDFDLVMVDDWVDRRKLDEFEKSNYEQIRPYHFVCDEGFYGNNEVYFGIPLKRIHLTKNGFRAIDVSDQIFVYKDCYEVKVVFDEGIPDMNLPPFINLSIMFAEKDLSMPIEYVHELQQAMRLMGCDKKIEL